MKPLLLFIGGLLSFSLLDAQSPWTQKANFPSGGRYAGAVFVIGNSAYFGTGFSSTTRKRDFWKYTPATDSWTQVASLPAGQARSSAAAFAIGGFGYLAAGQDSLWQLRNDLWRYDTLLNQWTQKASFPASGRIDPVAFSANGKGYLGFGCVPGNSFFKDMWEYDPAGDSWTQKTNFPGTQRVPAFCFVINNKAYIGSGEDYTWAFQPDFWEYDIAADTWTQKAAFGGAPVCFAAAFVYSGNGYVSTGYDNSISHDGFWEYNVATNAWDSLPDFPGGARYEAVGFTINNKGYFATGRVNNNQLYQDVWEYDPASMGIKENTEAGSLSFYPNPCINSTTIQLDKIYTGIALRIYTIDGKLVSERKNISGDKIEIDGGSLSAGTYFVSISSADLGVASGRLQVVK